MNSHEDETITRLTGAVKGTSTVAMMARRQSITTAQCRYRLRASRMKRECKQSSMRIILVKNKKRSPRWKNNLGKNNWTLCSLSVAVSTMLTLASMEDKEMTSLSTTMTLSSRMLGKGKIIGVCNCLVGRISRTSTRSTTSKQKRHDKTSWDKGKASSWVVLPIHL